MENKQRRAGEARFCFATDTRFEEISILDFPDMQGKTNDICFFLPDLFGSLFSICRYNIPA
jgi:hypothetical protein